VETTRVVSAKISGGAGAMIKSYRSAAPSVHPSVFIADGAQIIGDVMIGKDSSVWFNAVLRGDINAIRIGEGTNIQDGCILHVRHEFPLIVGSHVTMGHGVIAHACTIHDHVLLGMGAIILDNAVVNPYTLVAAGSLVKNNEIIPEGVLVAGVPARIIRRLTPEERTSIEDSARGYIGYARSYQS